MRWPTPSASGRSTWRSSTTEHPAAELLRRVVVSPEGAETSEGTEESHDGARRVDERDPTVVAEQAGEAPSNP